jgi:uncharacterized protein (TIGR02001 family)
MKKVVLSVVAALAVTASAAPAFAADMAVKAPKAAPPPPPYMLDIAVGGLVGSDYIFRGITQSNHSPSGGAYFEPDLTTPIGVFYVGLAGWAISWPTAFGFTDPSAEIDFYGGWRNAWGPLSLDIGLIYYYYPSETQSSLTTNSDFYEIYGKVGYEIVKGLTIGGNVFWTPDLLHYSESFTTGGISNKPDALYASFTAKWLLPWTAGDLGAYLSGELGHWWIDDAGFTNPIFVAFNGNPAVDPSYTYWNVGLAFTYKTLTLDLRYHGTDQSVQQCASFLLVGVPNPSNDWCDDRFVASLKFDTSVGIGH